MNSSIKLIVGLGNPGTQYEGTRHNAGEDFVRELARRSNAVFKRDARFHGETAEALVGSRKLRLLVPHTFMNASGKSVAGLANFYKIEPPQILIAHDELDLPPGSARFKFDGGHGGHNGLRDIVPALGNRKDFHRLRIGIGHPGHKDAVPGYVLRDFPKADLNWLDDMLRGISDGAAFLAAGDAGRFQNAVALRLNPPRSSTTVAKAQTKTAHSPNTDPDTAPDARSPLQKLVDKFR